MASVILSHRIAAHLNTMGVVNEAVKNAVGQRGIAYLLMPPRDWQCEVRIIDRIW